MTRPPIYHESSAPELIADYGRAQLRSIHKAVSKGARVPCAVCHRPLAKKDATNLVLFDFEDGAVYTLALHHECKAQVHAMKAIERIRGQDVSAGYGVGKAKVH
ncbi:MAG: hypothetical protein FJ189_00890 [Gammaproteobacteria bacterium]|nr:hypothetical protein [Gammaproteobacteria bacterium]